VFLTIWKYRPETLRLVSKSLSSTVVFHTIVIIDQESSTTEDSMRTGSIEKSSSAIGTTPAAVDSPANTLSISAAVRQRGALIGGAHPVAHVSESPTLAARSKDVETGSTEPPDSDYGGQPKRSLWEQKERKAASYKIRHTTDPVGTTENETKPRRISFLWAVLALISLFLAGICVAVGLLVFGGRNEASTSVDSNPILTTRQSMLHDIISTVSDTDALANATSPQSAASKWLLFQDQLWLDPEGEVKKERVIQRYVLAVFHFAMDGPVSWTTNNWLQGDECEDDKPWDGLACNSEKEVLTLAFGKAFVRISHAESEARANLTSSAATSIAQTHKLSKGQFLQKWGISVSS
jgi:hypothetical protein